MKRIVTSLLIAAGVLFTSTVARPTPRVSADLCDSTATEVVLGVVTVGYGLIACAADSQLPGVTTCDITNVDVTADSTGGVAQHHYQYEWCSYKAIAAYRADTQEASEELTSETDSSKSVLLRWTCAADPWTFPAGQMPHCTLEEIHPDQDLSKLDFLNSSIEALPLSAQLLTDQDRQMFDGQLQNALKALPPSISTSFRNSPTCAACGVVPIDTSANPVSTSKTCLACVQTPAPSLPDFTITSIIGNAQLTQGLSSTYDVILANLGAKPSGQVQVQIQVTGSLRYLQMAQTPAGWTCLGNGTVTCTGPLGGVGAPPTSVEFQLQVQAAQQGLGSISAYANPSNAIQESNENNNAQTLPVTVK
jgi:hypothetical protein